MMITNNDLEEIFKFKQYLELYNSHILYNQMNSIYLTGIDKFQIQNECYKMIYETV